ncbi:VanZ family protein [Salibacterium halotolerans]|uniref:Glycopeptide antibiotics resistance protein n=1 Tax=Salibacterium halotolerans TaxID=1884432 RepID=A0A1I5UTQ1_9BACI|nr:VanZ family protein [Salibacterium halotolerans]SFP98609.1 Glycopeptide antibiotics resistance protein [Salibacterium halotolerans]
MGHLNTNKLHKTERLVLKAKPVIMILLLLYLAVLFYVTLFAWNHGSSYGPVGPGGRNYNLDFFRSIYRIAVYSPDVVDPVVILGGNIVMFLPFGVLTALMLIHSKKAWWIVPGLSILLSLFIEINQYVFTHRVANVDDVFLNTIGGTVGFLLIIVIRSWMPKIQTEDAQKDNV